MAGLLSGRDTYSVCPRESGDPVSTTSPPSSPGNRVRPNGSARSAARWQAPAGPAVPVISLRGAASDLSWPGNRVRPLAGPAVNLSRRSRLGMQCLTKRDGRDKPGHDVEGLVERKKRCCRGASCTAAHLMVTTSVTKPDVTRPLRRSARHRAPSRPSQKPKFHHDRQMAAGNRRTASPQRRFGRCNGPALAFA